MRYLFVLSGPIGVGKSGLAGAFKERFGADRISTRSILIAAGTADERGALQAAGEELDRKSEGQWVADGVAAVAEKPHSEILLLDSARTADQILRLRRRFPGRVIHVHLTASRDTLADRYAKRPPQTKEFASYDEVLRSPTEAAIGTLAKVADVVIETDCVEPASVLARATAGLGLFPLQCERLVDVVVGGQFGSEGKGNICAQLAQGYGLLVRVGGPNAGHRVAHPEFKYVQIPSGTGSNLDAKIAIGAGATISIPTITREIGELGLTPDRLSIDENAIIIEQADQDAETKSGDKIGSTKQGVGVATARKILGRFDQTPLGSKVRLAKDADELRPFIRDTKQLFEDAYASGIRIMLEGTQGTDLSLHHAQYPHVTSRETTASGCLADAGIAPARVRRVVMVTRTYPIRVGGTSGPLPNEISAEVIAQRSGLSASEISATEVGTVSGKARRIGEFNWEQVRRAAVLNGATDLALTFADYLDASNREANRFEQLTGKTKDFIAELERVTNTTVSLISARFDERGIIDRRDWR